MVASSYRAVFSKQRESSTDHLVTGSKEVLRIIRIIVGEVAYPRLLVAGILLVVECENGVPVESLCLANSLNRFPVFV